MSLFHNYRIIYGSFFVALVLAIFPLPLSLSAFRPDWMILIIFYWVLALPHRVSVFHAFILGLLLDLLLGSILGMHALFFSVLAYVVSVNHQRIRYLTLVHTTLLVGVFIFVTKLSLYLLASNLQNVVLHKHYFWSIFTSMLLWPWFFLLMRFIRIHFTVV